MTKKIVLVIAVVILAVVVFGFLNEPKETREGKEEIVLDDHKFFVEIADTPEERQKGLSGHSPLAEDEGMLFVFEKLGLHSFWMKEMLFPLDILWLDENFKIVHIEENVPPESFPKSFVSDEPAKYVLEVSAGTVSKYGLKQN